MIFFAALQGCLILTTADAIMLWAGITVLPAVSAFLFSRRFDAVMAGHCMKFYATIVLFLGPFATLGSMIMILILPKKSLVEEYSRFISAEAVFSPSERMEYGLLQNQFETEEDITPYIDIMEGGDSVTKRNTINKVVQHPGPNSRMILNIGLEDPDHDIRFYAASALILLNDSFIKEFLELQNKINKSPDDPHAYLDLAMAYDRYCSWSLPEEEDLPNYIAKMRQAYEKVLQLFPENINAIIGLVRILLRNGELTKARSLVEKGLSHYPKSSNILLLYLRILYRKREFTQLRNLVNQFSIRFSNVAMEIQEAISYWKESSGNEHHGKHHIP